MIIVAVYVNDIILTCNDSASINRLIAHLHNTVNSKDLGPLSIFFGIEITYLPDGSAPTQRKYTTKLIRDAGIPITKPVTTPHPIILKLQHNDNSPLFSDSTCILS